MTLSPLTASPSPHRLIIDVREPSELADTGRIPSAVSMPITSNPDAFYLDNEEFFERFGFEKPVSSRKREGRGDGGANPYTEALKRREAGAGLNGGDEVEVGGEEDATDGGGVEEVIFYCKAGVRSRAAARMAREWQGVKVGDMKGGWLEWSANGGEVER
ncbi:MAG: Thiosulfate sulfurtransferase rdl2, mitochondrial [Ramalina farinacea]|uniref:Thiosulfate sulfurtransferase rdl2, mitochondrial n=1 Tax=Ramalina farinacea TaxID=258253 RepID=A0AA43QJF6_9LECA|nr:Thiosulfate sulfurtransferase rdl2, mitochondrial [Ramalina farinacea]